MSPDVTPGRRGFINAHTHLYGALAAMGMPAPAPRPQTFVQILARIWWRLDRAHDDRTLRASARLYVAEALLHGTTTLVDHHESPNCIEGSLDVLADACDELGIRALLCFGATERNGGRGEGQRGLAECRRFIRSNDRRLVRGAVGLHAPFTVSDDTIREASELCWELGAVLHVHLAEDRVELHDAAARGYSSPAARLTTAGRLPRGSILAHGVHLTAEEVRQTEDLGCWIVQNPRSNANNHVGYPRALGNSRRVALGTDGFPSDMRAEARSLIEESRRHADETASAPARLAAGEALAAEIFGPLEDECDLDEAGAVSRLRIAGREVVRGGTLQTADFQEIERHAHEAAHRLWRRMADIT